MTTSPSMDYWADPEVDARYRRQRRWARVTLSIIALVVVVIGGSIVWDLFLSSGCTRVEGGASSCTSQVGFGGIGEGEVSGVEVSRVRREQGLDTSVSFQIEGPADAVDDVLDAAGFTAHLDSEGLLEVQIDEGDLPVGVSEVRAGSDVWTDEDGTTWDRQVVRGAAPGGRARDVVYVLAFTT